MQGTGENGKAVILIERNVLIVLCVLMIIAFGSLGYLNFREQGIRQDEHEEIVKRISSEDEEIFEKIIKLIEENKRLLEKHDKETVGKK